MTNCVGTSPQRIALKGDYDLLSVVVAALSLFIIAAPIVSSKLDASWSSEFTFQADVLDPACVSPRLCFRYFNSRVERTPSGYDIAVRIEGADNVYAIAKELDEGTLKVIVPEGAGIAEPPKLEPRYDLYIAFDEVVRQIPASLRFHGLPPPRIT